MKKNLFIIEIKNNLTVLIKSIGKKDKWQPKKYKFIFFTPLGSKIVISKNLKED